MRAYRMLLRLYPASFRHEYGSEMTAMFALRRRDARGPLATATLWIGTIVEVAGNAAAVHWDILRQDMRYATRALANAPGFAITAVLVTALGIGANTAAFSVADFVLIRPLPFVNPDRLVTIWSRAPGYSTIELSPPNYRDLRAQTRAFEATGAFHDLSANLVGRGEPQRLSGVAVTGDLLPMLGVRPAIGRLFNREEDRGGAAAVLLGDELWRSTFAADPAVIGRAVTLDGRPYVVIGVMPKGFAFPDRSATLWVPMSAQEVADTDRTNNWFYMVGRLRGGVTIPQARADLDRIISQLARQYPSELAGSGTTVLALRDRYTNQARLLLLALCGAAVCILLIACANLGNLLLARSLVRARELAVRAALGAGRERLVRQLLTESLLLAVIGGIAGVGLAVTAVPLLTRLIPDSLPLAQIPAVDLRVLLVAAVLTVATGVGFGVAPALRAGGSNFRGLREGARAGGGRRERTRAALVIVEVAASVVLLVSAGLLMRAMWRIQAVDPGFRSDSVLTLRTSLPAERYGTVASRARLYRDVLDRVRAIPGVRSAAYASGLPMAMSGGIWGVSVAGEPALRTGNATASLRYITPGYFATLRIPVLRGRDVADGDTPATPYAAVVSETFARRYWPGVDPLGQHFTFAFSDRTVVGVVRDVRVRGPERTAEPQVYIPYQQVADSAIIGYIPKDIAIRSSLAAAALLPAVRQIIRAADPELPISNVRSMAEIVAGQTASRGTQVRILAAFAAIAILLAGIGIHGLLAFTVSQRSREIGVRLALGAGPRRIVGLVMRQGVGLALAGLVPGVAVAYLAARALQSLLAGIRPADPLTFALAVSLCAAMTLLGSLAAVLRAVGMDPSVVMRGE